MSCEMYHCDGCNCLSSVVYRFPAKVMCSDCLQKPSEQAARLANLPGLPEGWNQGVALNGRDLKKARLSLTDAEWDFLAAVYNACYSPAPGL